MLLTYQVYQSSYTHTWVRSIHALRLSFAVISVTVWAQYVVAMDRNNGNRVNKWIIVKLHGDDDIENTARDIINGS